MLDSENEKLRQEVGGENIGSAPACQVGKTLVGNTMVGKTFMGKTLVQLLPARWNSNH